MNKIEILEEEIKKTNTRMHYVFSFTLGSIILSFNAYNNMGGGNNLLSFLVNIIAYGFLGYFLFKTKESYTNFLVTKRESDLSLALDHEHNFYFTLQILVIIQFIIFAMAMLGLLALGLNN